MQTPLRVLMVEDSEDDTLLLAEALRMGGFDPQYTRVDTSSAMEQALADAPWDLVLADYAMPHFCGPAALQLLKESGKDVPFIVVSGTVTEQQAIDMMRQGAHDFILKQSLGRLAPAIRRELHDTQIRRERRQALDALEREQAFLASAIDLLPFPIIFNSPTGEVIRANQASYQFFGEADIHAWWNRDILYSETHEPIHRVDWPMMRAASGEVVPPVEGILVLPDGCEVDVLGVAAPVYLRETLVATVIAFIDISPIKEADRAKTRFLAILSHELRTPLTNILGWVKEAQDIPELVDNALRIIRRNAEMQRRMLERLLEVSRLLYGKFEMQRESADLWQLTEEVTRGLQADAAEYEVTIIMQAPTSPLPVWCDAKRLREAVESVLENAIRFTDAGGRILVRGGRADGMAEVSIQDTGCGIPPDMLSHVFELFHVSPEAAQTGGGLGLGLPLAKAIVERHGGTITLTSPGEGCGSTVIITLPLEDTP